MWTVDDSAVEFGWHHRPSLFSVGSVYRSRSSRSSNVTTNHFKGIIAGQSADCVALWQNDHRANWRVTGGRGMAAWRSG